MSVGQKSNNEHIDELVLPNCDCKLERTDLDHLIDTPTSQPA